MGRSVIPSWMLLQVSGGFAAEPAGEAGVEEGGTSGVVRMRNLVVGESTDMRTTSEVCSHSAQTTASSTTTPEVCSHRHAQTTASSTTTPEVCSHRHAQTTASSTTTPEVCSVRQCRVLSKAVPSALLMGLEWVITACKRRLLRLCFYTCLSVRRGEVCIQGRCVHRGWGGVGQTPYWILWDAVNEGAVRILLECILLTTKRLQFTVMNDKRSRSDCKTWKNGKAFSTQGKVRKNHTNYWKTPGKEEPWQSDDVLCVVTT